MSDFLTPSSLLAQPAVQELIARGASRGSLSYDEINDLLSDLQLDEDAVELLLEALEKRAILVEEAAPEPTSPPKAKRSPRKKRESTSGEDSTLQPEDLTVADIPNIGIPSMPNFSTFSEDADDLDSLLAELDALIPDDEIADLVGTAGDDVETGQEPVEDALKLYLNRMGQVPRMSREEEAQVARQMYLGTENERLEAKNKLVEANLRLVVHLASHAAPRTTLSITDLLQEGNLGLLDAVTRYNPTSGKAFGSYATWYIRRAVNRAINEHVRSVKLSGELYGAIQKMQRGQRELSQKLNRTPSRVELAEFTGLTVAQVEEAQRAAARPLSLEAHVGSGEDGLEFGETLADKESELASDASDRRELGQGLVKVLEELSDKERNILEMRFGLGRHADTGSLAAEDVARRLGLSRERVHDLEVRAIRKMRQKARGAGLTDFFED